MRDGMFFPLTESQTSHKMRTRLLEWPGVDHFRPLLAALLYRKARCSHARMDLPCAGGCGGGGR